MIRRRRVLVLAALALLPRPRPTAAGFAVHDMTGRALTLPAPPERIVSLVPSVTEIVYALGGEARLAGRTDFCDWPPAAQAKPSVGGMIAPNLEALAALRPDLVVMTPSGNRHETMEQIRRLGVPIYLVDVHRVAQMMDVIARLGALTGREAAVGALVDRLTRRIDAVRRAVAPFPRPRVLYALWPEPLIVPARDSHITEMIALAGGDSVTAEDPGDYPRLSLEAAVARAPEVIVLARHGKTAPPAGLEKWQRLTSLPAVRRGRVQSVDGNLVHRYGPRLVDGIEALARIIHPEAFR